MVIRRETVTRRLEELDQVVQELSLYKSLTKAELRTDLSQRWIVERGLIAAAALVLDTSNHILSGHFGYYTETYEESLLALRDKDVISDVLYQQIKGLGGFRNVLVHLYQDIDPILVWEYLQKGLTVFPSFSQQVLAWLDALEPD